MFKKLIFLLLFPIIAFSQQTLKGHFNPEEGYQFAILYRITPSNVFYVTDANIAKDGTFEVTLPADLKPGMHRLVYNLPQDLYFFDFIYNGKEPIEFNFSNDEGATYISSEENKIWSDYRKELNNLENELAGQFSGTEVDKEEVQKLLNEKKIWFDEAEAKAKGTYAEFFIAATKPYIPEKFEGKKAYLKNAKAAKLNTLDISNPLLQNSAVPLEQSLIYIFNYIDPDDVTDSRENHIDDISDKLKKAEPDYQKNLLKSIYDYLVANGQIKEANYLAEKHLIKITEDAGDKEFANQLKTFKSLSYGEIAPDFSWPVLEGFTDEAGKLSKLEGSKNYILVFWSSLCSHCLKEVPLLHEKIEGIDDSKIKVIAVGLEDFEQEWAPRAAEFPKFINVLGLGKWENEIGNKYNVTATPTYYFLDSEKKIKAKPETLEELMMLIDAKEE